MPKLVGMYLRVSTRKQDERSQEPDLKRWVAGQDSEVIWYRDAFTGTTMTRPAMDRLLADVRSGKVGTVVVWRLDRLGRTAKGLTALFEELRDRGVNLISLRDGVDLATPAGRLMANVLASVAAYENEVRRERVLAGQAAARAKGVRWSGSQKGRLIKVTPEQVVAVKRMKGEGSKIATIARATGLSRPTVYRLLNGPKSRKNRVLELLLDPFCPS
jgi:DNA invertase Pin-like site-specific DNA recombinase